MHAGFKGVRLGLTELTLRGTQISYEVSFIDSDGVVHGHMRHSYPLGGESEINTKVDALVTALLNEAAVMHFASPAGITAASDLASGGAPGGLAEALGATGTAIDEPQGTPG